MEANNNLIAHALSEFIALADEEEALPLNDAAVLDSSQEPLSMATETLLSPENEAWLDSCLVDDPELPQDVRAAMEDALLDTLMAANATGGTNQMQKESKAVETSQVVVDSDTKEEIFRVWDLGNILVEEEEVVLIKQLKEAFGETRIGDLPVERGDQEIEDELINVMAHLSLEEIEDELIDVMAEPFSD